jgi:hypothetical protein
MTSLNLLRTAAAARFWNGLGRRAPRGEQIEESFRRLGAAVHRQGLLSTAATVREHITGSQPLFEEALLLDVGQHLVSREVGLLSFPLHSLNDLVQGLTATSSVLLLPATLESLNYLGFLKRMRPR